MLQLFCWDRVTPEIKRVTEESLKRDFDEKIVSISISGEYPGDVLDRYVRNGVTYRYNLPVVAWLKVMNPPANRGNFSGTYLPVGVKDGRYLLTLMAPAETAEPQAQSNSAVIRDRTRQPAQKSQNNPPAQAVVLAKTLITVRLGQDVGLRTIKAGGVFYAVVAEPVAVNGVTVIPVGTPAQGIVRRTGGYSPYMTLTSLTEAGRRYSIHTGQSIFNEEIVFPKGTRTSFELLFPVTLNLAAGERLH